MKLKPGDKLTFEVDSVLQTGDSRTTLRFKGTVASNLIVHNSIQHIESAPEPLKVGDKVRMKNTLYPADYDDFASITHIAGDLMWITTPRSRTNLVRPVGNYERVPVH